MFNPYLGEKTRIINKKCETEQDCKFILDLSLSTPNPGQFMVVSIPKLGECPISISDFGRDWTEIAVRRAGKVTTGLHSLQKDDYIYARGPYGNGFPLNKFKGKHLIAVGGGTGIGPVKSLIQYYSFYPQAVQKLDLLAGFKTTQDIIFLTELQKWKHLFNVVLSVEHGEDWVVNKGVVTDFIQSLQVEDPVNTEVILVGPSQMMNQALSQIFRMEIPEENIELSLERRMSCGIGKCGHCRMEDIYVCLDGPVFNYSQIKDSVD